MVPCSNQSGNHGGCFGHAYCLNKHAYFPFQGNDFDKFPGDFQKSERHIPSDAASIPSSKKNSPMQPATSRRLQAYLSGLATTTGLVASSGAAIVNIDISDISGPNANLADGVLSINYGMVPGLPDLVFYASNGYLGLYGFAAVNPFTVGGGPPGSRPPPTSMHIQRTLVSGNPSARA